MKELPPYTKLAAIYDRLMDHVDYEQWGDYVMNLISSTSQNINSLIDLSCGTGSFISHMCGRIDKVYGCDNSQEMINEAKKKIIKGSENLFINDICNCALKDNIFDCALFLYDSLNYLIDDNSLFNSFSEIHRILKTRGLFIFDIVSESHCIEHYGDFHESEYWEEDGYSRHSYYDGKKGYQYNKFRIVLKGKTYIEKHQQKIYGIDYLKTALKEKSFKIIGIYDNFSNPDSNDEKGRIHFLCIKS